MNPLGEIIQEIRFEIDRAYAEKAAYDASIAGQKVGAAVSKGATSGISRLGMAMSVALGISFQQLLQAATRAVINFTKESINLAVAAEDAAEKIQMVFGQATAKVREFLATWATMAGLDTGAADQLATRLGLFARSLGMSQNAAADFSVELLKLAGDLYAFKGIAVEEALEQLTKGLLGQYRGVRMLIPSVTKARIEQVALNMAHKSSVKDLTAAERATAFLRVATEGMGVQAGALAREAGDVDNRMASWGAVMRNIKADIGRELLPTVRALMETLVRNKSTIEAVARAIGQGLAGALAIVGRAFKLLSMTMAVVWQSGTEGVLRMTAFVDKLHLKTMKAQQALFRLTGQGDKADLMSGPIKRAEDDLARLEGRIEKVAGIRRKLEEELRALGKAPIGKRGEDGGGATGDLGGDGGFGDIDEDGGDKDAAKKAAEAEAERVAMLIEGSKHAGTRAEALKLLVAEEFALAQRILAGNMELAERVKLEERLAAVRGAIEEGQAVGGANESIEGKIATARAKRGDTSTNIAAYGDFVRLEREIRTEMENTNLSAKERLALAQQLSEVQSEMATYAPEDVLSASIMTGFDEIISGSGSVMDAFGLMIHGVGDVNNAMALLGKGGAKAMLGELAKMAKGKVMENLAHAIEKTAHGIWEAAHGNPQAVGSFLSAAKFAAAAGAWQLVAGAARGGAGVGGSRGGGGSAPDRVEGQAVDDAARGGPDIIINLHAIDRDNPDHQAIVGGMASDYQEAWGGNIILNRK